MATKAKPSHPLQTAYRVFSSSGNTLVAQLVIAMLLALIALTGAVAHKNGVPYQFRGASSCSECR